MSNLLDLASIVLTPTAYNNGEALCIKPDDGSGDFTFSRNSAATRVNAQGLVENVQILSSNLVQNGDFSEEGVQEVSNGSFSQEGVQLITNGDFSSDTAWVKGTGTTISGGSANFVNAGGVSLYQSIGTQSGFVKITFNVTDYTSGTLNVYSGGNQSVNTINVSANALGTYTAYVDRNGGNVNIIFGSIDNFIGSIDNVSVREVGQDWTFTSGATLTDIGAKITHAPTAGSIAQLSVLTIGKQYKLTYEITESISGGLKFNSAVNSAMVTTVGVHTKYFEADGTTAVFGRTDASNNDVTITNISVKEVGQNWTLVSANASIGENKLIANSVVTENIATQSGVVPISKPIILKFDLILNSGGFRVLAGSGGTATNITTSGTYTLYETSGTGGTLTLQSRFGGFDGSITNISVIEISTDTNLPRINYEGFSYQDALGSELVTNGDFATNSDWSMQASWSIANGKASYNGASNGHYIKQNASLTIGSQYIAKFDILDNSGNFRISVDGGTASYNNYTTGNGTYSFTFVASSSEFFIRASMGFSSDTFSIDNVSVKEYLGQEVVPDSGCGSWLFEPQSTNLVTYSEDFSQWIASGCTVGNSSSIVSPSNSNNIGIITGTIGTGAKFARINVITSSSILTYSAFFKYNSHQWVQFASGGTSEYANFDIQNGVVGDKLSGTTATIDNFGNGWYRCTLSTSVASTPSNMALVLIDTANSSRLTATSSVGSAYIWGAQLEALSYATSYIPTSGSTVTRNQDVCTNGGSLASINSTEGVLYAEIAALSDDGTNRIISISDGTNGNRVQLYYSIASNSIFAIVFSGGVLSCSLNTTLSDTTINTKLALKYKQNDFALWVNGIEVSIDTSGNTPIGLDRLDFSLGSGILNFFGKTKAVAVWKEALSDQELTELTTI